MWAATFVFVIAVTFPAVICQKGSAEFKKAVSKCTEKNGVKEDDFNKMIAALKFPETKQLRCTVECIVVEGELLKDGVIDIDKVIKKRGYTGQTATEAKEVLKSCQAKPAEAKEECGRATIYLGCFYDLNKMQEAKKGGGISKKKAGIFGAVTFGVGLLIGSLFG